MAEERAWSTARSMVGIVGALNREWLELARDGSGSVAGWSARHPALRECTTLDAIVAAVGSDSDAVLAALLAEVASGDRLAGRVVLQAMIGRVAMLAARDPRAGVDDYLSALWCRIVTYPLKARPSRIAANLSMDTLQLVSRERRWLTAGEVTPWPPVGFLELPDDPQSIDPGPTARRVIDAGRHLGLMDQPTADLLGTVYLDGWSSDRAARRHKTSPGTVRVRCSRAVSLLAAHAGELLEAC